MHVFSEWAQCSFRYFSVMNGSEEGMLSFWDVSNIAVPHLVCCVKAVPSLVCVFICISVCAMLYECGVWAREGCQVSFSTLFPYNRSLSETRARLAARKLKWPFCLCSHIALGPQGSIHSCPVPYWVLGFELGHSCLCCQLSYPKAVSSSPACFLYITRLAKFNFFFAPNHRHLGK